MEDLAKGTHSVNQKKRVLVIDNLAVESSRRSVYRAMREKGDFEVHLLVPHKWKETTDVVDCEPEDQNSLDIQRTGILFGFRHHRVVYRGLFRIIRKLRPDFVLAVHAPENYATLQLLAVRKLFQPALRIGLFASRNIDLPSAGFPYKLAFLNSMCDWITAQSKVDAVFHRPRAFGYLYQRYTANTVYIPHSVDCTLFKPDRSPRRDSPRATVIGYVGRLVEAKGVHLLIEALSKLPAHVNLCITGEGPWRVKLEALAATLGVADRVTFQPLIPYASMPQLLNGYDVLVLPSLETGYWKELFGRVLIEAMACEVPVVASHSGGIPEVVGDAGILFKPGNVDDLKRKLLELLTRPRERKDLAQRGRERVLQNFDTPVVAGQLAKAIAHILRP